MMEGCGRMEGRLVYEDKGGKEWGRVSTNLSYGMAIAAVKNFEAILEKDKMQFTITYYQFETKVGVIQTALTCQELITAIREFEIQSQKRAIESMTTFRRIK